MKTIELDNFKDLWHLMLKLDNFGMAFFSLLRKKKANINKQKGEAIPFSSSLTKTKTSAAH